MIAKKWDGPLHEGIHKRIMAVGGCVLPYHLAKQVPSLDHPNDLREIVARHGIWVHIVVGLKVHTCISENNPARIRDKRCDSDTCKKEKKM